MGVLKEIIRELESEQIFLTINGDVVKLDHRVPGDATQWRIANWVGGSWAYYENTIEPGDLADRLPDDFPVHEGS